ncbi:hypothetical protein FNL56_06165 [Tardiphaga sp. vice304]|uniref:hypothetical protein n=1 Tax=unclassified Tardiphaga TaxID=2631404 RepID=UPI001162F768|nr:MULTISPECIES: hypothetical protein [unclassified Tardiphaga]QDM15539.1 hypothetical protein FNL53_06100 [Tardiphaga sp. vice278]QDM20604.1 hypothetical protein FIU28_05285 [Tardiphaga sp. vice154]QDM25737.1 hypothetical protein FNL56_06165 [Tardiphaga sp. vice304]
MNHDQKILNEEHGMQHACDVRHDLLISALQEIKNEVSRISQKLMSRSLILSNGAGDAYPQLSRRLLSPLADYPDTFEVVRAHFIPQCQKEHTAYLQMVLKRYLKAYGTEPMLAKHNGHLYAKHHGFLDSRASSHLVTQANIEGDVFWVPDPADHQIWPALVMDASGETPADLRARIEPHLKGQFTVEGFGPKFVLCFETERDFIIAKLHLG